MSMTQKEEYFYRKLNDKLYEFPYKVIEVNKIKTSFYSIKTECTYYDKYGEEKKIVIICEKWLAKDLITNTALSIIEYAENIINAIS